MAPVLTFFAVILVTNKQKHFDQLNICPLGGLLGSKHQFVCVVSVQNKCKIF